MTVPIPEKEALRHPRDRFLIRGALRGFALHSKSSKFGRPALRFLAELLPKASDGRRLDHHIHREWCLLAPIEGHVPAGLGVRPQPIWTEGR